MKTLYGFFITFLDDFRLYPTFKEWKLSFSSNIFTTPFCLYPTFKEWKRATGSERLNFGTQFISYL